MIKYIPNEVDIACIKNCKKTRNLAIITGIFTTSLTIYLFNLSSISTNSFICLICTCYISYIAIINHQDINKYKNGTHKYQRLVQYGRRKI